MRGFFCFVVVFVVLDFSSFVSGTKTYPRFVNTTPSNPPFESALFDFLSQGCVILLLLVCHVSRTAMTGRRKNTKTNIQGKKLSNAHNFSFPITQTHKHTAFSLHLIL